MKDKLRIELASENRLGRDTFYAELDLPATAEQIKDAKQRARFTDDGDMIYRAVSILYFPLLPDLEHIRLDSATVEELNFLAQRLDSLPDEQFTIYQALFKQRFGDVDSDELLSVKNLINMTYGLDSVMVASNMPNEKNLIPNSERTPEERKRIAAAGGRASGVSRRRKKSLKATMRVILDLPVTGAEDWNELANAGIDQDDYNNQTLMLLGLFRAAVNGNVKAVREIRSILQEQTETPLEAKERKLRIEKAAAEVKTMQHDPGEDALQSFLKAIDLSEDEVKELFTDEAEE